MAANGRSGCVWVNIKFFERIFLLETPLVLGRTIDSSTRRDKDEYFAVCLSTVLEPIVGGIRSAMKSLSNLASSCTERCEDIESCALEVQPFHSDDSLHVASTGTRLDSRLAHVWGKFPKTEQNGSIIAKQFDWPSNREIVQCNGECHHFSYVSAS